jgi:hypothetical protein
LRQTAPGNGKADEALAWYKKAFDRKEGRLDPSFAEEYIPLLIEQGRVEEAAAELAAYTVGLGDAALQGPLLDAAARIAFAHNDDAALDGIFSREPARIREGNTTLVDLWAAREIRRLVSAGVDRDAAETRIRKALAAGNLAAYIRGNGSYSAAGWCYILGEQPDTPHPAYQDGKRRSTRTDSHLEHHRKPPRYRG